MCIILLPISEGRFSANLLFYPDSQERLERIFDILSILKSDHLLVSGKLGILHRLPLFWPKSGPKKPWEFSNPPTPWMKSGDSQERHETPEFGKLKFCGEKNHLNFEAIMHEITEDLESMYIVKTTNDYSTVLWILIFRSWYGTSVVH